MGNGVDEWPSPRLPDQALSLPHVCLVRPSPLLTVSSLPLLKEEETTKHERPPEMCLSRGTAARPCNHGTRDLEDGVSEVQSHPWLQVTSKTAWAASDPASKINEAGLTQ